jgi:hypothetical protein
MGPFARAFSDELHCLFDGKIHDVFGVPVAIFFASGFTQLQLSSIGNLAAQGATVVAVSGDDSFVAWGSYGAGKFGEADQSKFDHTQDEGPMKCFMSRILFAFGFPSAFVDLAYHCCSSGYTAKRGRLFVKGFCGVQMPTGITTTTTFNSLSTLAMYIAIFERRVSADALPVVGRSLGFDVKYSETDFLSDVTFLKGWWQLTCCGDVSWVPLPSAVIKLGKVLRDPVQITAVKVGSRTRRDTPDEAVRRCAYALAMSYGEVDPNYPILGPFVSVLRRLGRPNPTPLCELQESWKPSMSGINIDRASVVESVCRRYSLTPQAIFDAESLIREVTSLPAYVQHPVFDALADVDY